MVENIRYINHMGEYFDIGSGSIYAKDENEIRSYAWKRKESEDRITGFKREVKSKKISLVIKRIDDQQKTVAETMNNIIAVTDKDIIANKYGRLVIGDWYMKCFISASEKKSYHRANGTVYVDLTVTTDRPYWQRDAVTELTTAWGVTIIGEVCRKAVYEDGHYDYFEHEYNIAELMRKGTPTLPGAGEEDDEETAPIIPNVAESIRIEGLWKSFEKVETGGYFNRESTVVTKEYVDNTQEYLETELSRVSERTSTPKTWKDFDETAMVYYFDDNTPGGYGYPYAYTMKNNGVVSNDHYAPSTFLLEIFGPSAGLNISIGGNRYKVDDVAVPEDARLIVDSEGEIGSQVYILYESGIKSNVFKYRDIEFEILKDMPAGDLVIDAPEGMHLKLTLHNVRSEPAWT